jgi:hypothetical protein
VLGELLMLLLLALFPSLGMLALKLYGFYFLLNFIYSLILNKNLQVAFLSIFSVWIQLNAYGYGFLYEAYRYWILGIKEIQTR